MTPYVRDRRANFRQSLSVLEHAKKEGARVTKTSIMLGVGETEEEVVDALKGISTHRYCLNLLNLIPIQNCVK
jgi:lipoate synthase